ncbi:YCF48-related protein [Candidatus Zixiibacteriota bacterium]
MLSSRVLKIGIVVISFLIVVIIINCNSNKNPLEFVPSNLVVDTASVDVIAPRAGLSPVAFFVNVGTDTGDPVLYSFTNKSVWLELQNATGQPNGITPDSFLVRFRISSPFLLDVGTYYDTITITSEDALNVPLYKEIKLSIGSELSISPPLFEFSGATFGNDPRPQYIKISSTTSENYAYTISIDSSWLSIPISSGITSDVDSFPVSIDLSSMDEGFYSSNITITADDFLNSPIIVPCNLSVSPWVSQTSPLNEDLQGVFFEDVNNGWAVGFLGDAHSRKGVISSTVDGGLSWQLNLFDNNNNFGLDTTLFGAIQFIGDTGWVVGENGLIIKSIDHGQNWNKKPNGLSSSLMNLNNIYFINSQLGWIVGDSGTVLRSTDGGETWTKMTQITSLGLYGISFVDEENGWVCGVVDNILRTYDGGLNWTKQSVPPSQVITNSYDFNDIFFVDINHGWAVGKLGFIINTVNGGITWEVIQLDNRSKLNAVFFNDIQTGWVAGQNGSLLKTTNGGLTWNELFSGTENWLLSLYFVDATHGWAVGQYGTILSTSSGGIK